MFIENEMTTLLYIGGVYIQWGSTTITTLDLIHRQEITRGAGGAAICSLNLRMCPCLVRVYQTVFIN